MKQAFLLALGICAVGSAWAQWDVPVPVVLDGDDPAQRQVTGVAPPAMATDGANLDADRYRTTTFGTTEGTDALTLHLSPPLSAYRPGLRLTISPQAVNLGDVTLDVDGLGPVPVRKFLTAPLDSGDLVPGVPVDLVYDGAVFQVGNQLHPACPAGLRPIGRESCIETTAYDAVNWFTANTRCVNRGLRLCSFGEWMRACLLDPEFLATVSDYEWVDEAANEYARAKTVGLNATTHAPDCYGGGHKTPLELSRYRCCSER